MTSIGTTETPRRNSRGAVANMATREPSNVATTFTRVAGEQSIVDIVQKHSIFLSRYHFSCVWIVALDQMSINCLHHLAKRRHL